MTKEWPCREKGKSKCEADSKCKQIDNTIGKRIKTAGENWIEPQFGL